MKNTEEQLLSGIEQTSQTIRDSLNTRANITATAIQQSDEKIAQSIQNNAQTVEKQLSQYQALLQSKLSHLTKLNEQIQSQEQQAQNQAGTEKTYHFEYGTDFSSSYFAYSDFLAWSRHQKQVRRDADSKYRNQREANESRPFEPIGGHI